MGIFDNDDEGTVSFRELLTTFALAMNASVRYGRIFQLI